MYETQAFWGLESNTNACTLNSSLNTIYDVGGFIPLILVVVAIGAILMMTTSRGFG